jgi:hypothetical protein
MLSVSFWPLAEGPDFPKQAVQAAATGKSSHSLLEAVTDKKPCKLLNIDHTISSI